MDRMRSPSTAPRRDRGPIEDGTTIPLQALQSILAGDNKLLILGGAHTKARVAAVHGTLYLRGNHNEIITLADGTYPIPGLPGISIRVDLRSKQVTFLSRHGKSTGGCSYSIETFHDGEKKPFSGRVEEVLAKQSVDRRQARVAILVAFALAGAAGMVGSRSCSIPHEEAALAPAEEGE